MAGPRPEERVAWPVLRQSWRQMTFLHWWVDPDVVQARLPAGLEVDLVDGSAWIGLTPFRVERFRALGVVPLQVAASFPETNLRTYVRTRGGPAGGHDLAVRPGAPLTAGDVEGTVGLLTGRWRAFVAPLGRLLAVPVAHQPWPLRTATVEHLDESLFIAAGLPRPEGEPLVHFSDGVDTRLGAPRPVRRAS